VSDNSKKYFIIFLGNQQFQKKCKEKLFIQGQLYRGIYNTQTWMNWKHYLHSRKWENHYLYAHKYNFALRFKFDIKNDLIKYW